jgi:hypothetical protein
MAGFFEKISGAQAALEITFHRQLSEIQKAVISSLLKRVTGRILTIC